MRCVLARSYTRTRSDSGTYLSSWLYRNLADNGELALCALADLVDARQATIRDDDLLRLVRVVVVDVLPVSHLLASLLLRVRGQCLRTFGPLLSRASLLAAIGNAGPRQQKQQKSSP